MINDYISVLLGRNTILYINLITKKYFRFKYSLRFVDHLNSKLVMEITRLNSFFCLFIVLGMYDFAQDTYGIHRI